MTYALDPLPRTDSLELRVTRRQAQVMVRKTRTPRSVEPALGGPRQGGRLISDRGSDCLWRWSERIENPLYEAPSQGTLSAGFRDSIIEQHNGTGRGMDATSERIQRIRPSGRIWSTRELPRSPTYPGRGAEM